MQAEFDVQRCEARCRNLGALPNAGQVLDCLQKTCLLCYLDVPDAGP